MKLENVKYQLATFIRYTGDAFIYPFLALYLKSIGLVNSDVGIIMMILPLIAIFVNPIWSRFSKNVNYNRIFVSILTIIEALAVILLVNVGSNILFISLVVFLIGVAGQPFYILFDSYVVMYCRLEDFQYSRIRIFGSLAYVITVIGSGILAAYDFKLAFYVGAGIFILTSFIITWIKPLNISEDNELTAKPEPRKLIKNKSYWKYVILVTLTMGVSFTFDTYLPVYLQEMYNVNEMHFGFIVSGYVLVEIVIISLLNKFGRRMRFISIYAVMISSLVIRYGVYVLSGYVSIPAGIIIAITMLRAIPVAVTLYMMMDMTSYLVEPNNITSASIIMGSIRAAFTTVLVLSGGYLTTNPNNYKYWFLIGASLALVGFLFVDYKISVKTGEDMVKYNVVMK